MRTSLRFPYPSFQSGSEKAAPLGESGGAGLLGVAVLEVALGRKVIVDRGMDCSELLQRSHAPEPQHRPFESSERQMRVLRPVFGPASHFAVITAAQVFQSGTVGPRPIRHGRLRTTMPFQ